MSRTAQPAAGRPPIAVVGLACRYPDADDPPALLDLVATGRRAFRRIPPGRLDLADYYSPNPRTPDATYSTRAALIEGWRFDPATFRVSDAAYRAADPAHWLALETAGRALAAAGFPSGAGLPSDRTGVIIGSAHASDLAPASALRLRWPFARRTLAEALYSAGIRGGLADQVMRTASARYLAPFPQISEETLAGTMPATIATMIANQFGFRGGGSTVDGGGASSLVAVASACLALATEDLDFAVTGGVDLSLDPLELVGLAKSGVLATSDMRVYDENPTGFLPGEGCGIVLLMRSADARAAQLPVYAEILGWGTASAGQPRWPAADRRAQIAANADSQLLALRDAYRKAGVDPADVQFIEGSGTGIAAGDEAEITALTALRAGIRQRAALGSIAANIGNTRAAAGAAGLIKAVLAIANGVLPPATGFRTPHPMLREPGTALRLPTAPERWPEGDRLAGVSAMGPGGLNVHLVLRGHHGRHFAASRRGRVRPGDGLPATWAESAAAAGSAAAAAGSAATAAAGTAATAAAGTAAAAGSAAAARPAGSGRSGNRPAGELRPAAYLLHAPDRRALSAVLARIADVALWLSDGQMNDLASRLACEATTQGEARVAIVATRQEQLARLASEAMTMLPGLSDGLLAVRPGIFAADGADGRVTFLFSDAPGPDVDGRLSDDPPRQGLGQILAALRWLDALGVRATAAVGHGVGELAGLVWAGCASAASARALNAARATALAGPPASASALLNRAIDELAIEFRPPRRRLISGCTGIELAGCDGIIETLNAGLGPAVRLSQAVRAGAVGASLLVETGPGSTLVTAAGRLCKVPAVSLDGGPGDDRHAARAAAALFAVGALTQPGHLAAGRSARPIDIWRDQVFITSPGQAAPRRAETRLAQTRQPETRRAQTRQPASPPSQARQVASPPARDRQPARPPTGTLIQRAATAAAPSASAGTGQYPKAEHPYAVLPAASPDAGHLATSPGVPADVSRLGFPVTAGSVVAGVAPWSRCYVEQLREPADPVPGGNDGPWRLHIGGCEPLRLKISELFRHDQAAGRTLAVLGDLDDAQTSEAAIRAAGDAISSGQLVVISSGPELTGLWASLHAEYPALGITALRAPLTADGIEAARQLATARRGEFRELVIGTDGSVREPIMVPAQLTRGGSFPLGQDDVVLVSRGSGAALLALAQVLACCGAAVAIIGRDHAEPDENLIAELEQLRSAGARVSYEVVDAAVPAAVAAAVQRIERRLGPVTAIGHAVGQTPRLPVAGLNAAELQEQLRSQTAVLDQLVGAVRANPAAAGQLRLILTFGSVAARYPKACESVLALVSGALASHGQRLASRLDDCRALHIDWPGWSGDALGERPDLAASMERAGITPMPVAEGSRQLFKVLATGGLPARLAVHGRVGRPAPHLITAASPGNQWPAGRFAEQVLAHYPGVELILEASLSLRADPYLADYRVDNVPVLPPTMALEAMAQAASILAGAPVRTATDVTMTAPVVLPAGQPGSSLPVRICALREAGAITVVLRCANSGFLVDHYKAVFSCAVAEPERRPIDAPEHARPAAARRRQPDRAADADRAVEADRAAEVIDGSELYGPICFQTGRFRRLAAIRPVTAHAATAVARGSDDLPWFGASPRGNGEPGESGLLLGSAGLSDATLQLVQACVPHRRLVPAGCEAVSFSGRPAEGPVTIRATEIAPSQTTTAGAQTNAPAGADASAGAVAGAGRSAAAGPLVPRQRTAAPVAGSASIPAAVPAIAPALTETVWNIEATDATGQRLITWRRLRMRDAGPLPHLGWWPVPLLAGYLQRASTALGLDPSLEIQIWRGAQPGSSPAGRSPAGRSPADSSPDAQPPGEGRGRDWRLAAPSDDSLAGLSLQVRAAGPAVCGWQTVRQTPQTGETAQYAAARDAAVAACLCAASAPTGLVLSDLRMAGDGWLVQKAGAATIASTVTKVAGVRNPVAIALMTGTPSVDGKPAAARTGRGRSRLLGVTSP